MYTLTFDMVAYSLRTEGKPKRRRARASRVLASRNDVSGSDRNGTARAAFQRENMSRVQAGTTPQMPKRKVVPVVLILDPCCQAVAAPYCQAVLKCVTKTIVSSLRPR